MKRYVIFLIILSFVHCASAQWTLETVLPWDDTYGAGKPDLGVFTVVDSSVSWVTGEYYYPAVNQLYLAKRNSTGWHEIKHHDLDTSFISLTCIAALDTSNAWVANYRGKMLHTTNGGYNWVLQVNLGQGTYFNGLQFSKKFPNIGFAFADGPGYTGVYVLKTTNSGTNWVQQFISIPGYIGVWNSMSIIDSTHAWFGLYHQGGGVSKLLRTTNGGLSWDIITILSADAGSLNIVFSSDKLTGLCSVYGNSPDRIMRSTNSGSTWSASYYFNDPYYIENMNWVEESSNIYFNSYGEIRRSVNNGSSWTTMNVPIPPGFQNQIWLLDAVKINAGSIYALAITNSLKVLKLVDTLRLIGIQKISNTVPKSFILKQNYPNPFNPTTTFEFAIPTASHINLCIYNSIGEQVEILTESNLNAGTYSAHWDASRLASGVYFYTLFAIGEGKTYSNTKKRVLIK